MNLRFIMSKVPQVMTRIDDALRKTNKEQRHKGQHESVSGPGHQDSQDKIIRGHPLIKFAILTASIRMINQVTELQNCKHCKHCEL